MLGVCIYAGIQGSEYVFANVLSQVIHH